MLVVRGSSVPGVSPPLAVASIISDSRTPDKEIAPPAITSPIEPEEAIETVFAPDAGLVR